MANTDIGEGVANAIPNTINNSGLIINACLVPYECLAEKIKDGVRRVDDDNDKTICMRIIIPITGLAGGAVPFPDIWRPYVQTKSQSVLVYDPHNRVARTTTVYATGNLIVLDRDSNNVLICENTNKKINSFYATQLLNESLLDTAKRGFEAVTGINVQSLLMEHATSLKFVNGYTGHGGSSHTELTQTKLFFLLTIDRHILDYHLSTSAVKMGIKWVHSNTINAENTDSSFATAMRMAVEQGGSDISVMQNGSILF